jgi:pyruvate/2-oxoglutarate dehydrogenase complex dihydrolipoamide acyltransferase (E2) component
MTEIKLPELAEGIEKATVTLCHFKKGDTVKENDDLIEFATDKATFNVPSPASGKIIDIMCSEGDEIAVGQVIAKIS